MNKCVGVLIFTHHIHVHIEREVLWGSGLVLCQVLDKFRLLWYKTGSKQTIAITALISESKFNATMHVHVQMYIHMEMLRKWKRERERERERRERERDGGERVRRLHTSV